MVHNFTMVSTGFMLRKAWPDFIGKNLKEKRKKSGKWEKVTEIGKNMNCRDNKKVKSGFG